MRVSSIGTGPLRHFYRPDEFVHIRRVVTAIFFRCQQPQRREQAMIETGNPRNPPNLLRTIACVVIAMVAAVGGSAAQTNSPPDWAAPTTVLTMAPDGAWGAATHDLVGTAIAAAIADCRQRFRFAKGCGAYQMTMRAGWLLGIRCGGRNILVAEKTLMEAEQAAIDREIELRSDESELPPCVRFVSVDPSGAVVAPYTKGLLGMLIREPVASPR